MLKDIQDASLSELKKICHECHLKDQCGECRLPAYKEKAIEKELYSIHSLCVNADGFENHEKPPDLSYSKAEHWRKFNEWKNDKGAHFFAEE